MVREKEQVCERGSSAGGQLGSDLRGLKDALRIGLMA